MAIRIGRFAGARRRLGVVVAAWVVLAAPALGGLFAQAPLATPLYQGKPAKYVIFFIGDGMGLAQRTATELFLAAMESSAPQSGVMRLAMNRMPAQGLSTTFSASSTITESAAAGTALSCGQKTAKGVIGMDAAKTLPLKTIAEMAKEHGLKVGIVSTASIDHATPACFYAHQPKRKMYHEIGMELAASNFDYFAGGGFLKPRGKGGKQDDVFVAAQANGFTFFRTTEEILSLRGGEGKAIVIHPVLDRDKAVSFDIDRKTGEPTLADLTRKGIEVLYNPHGFFMMVEGGRIDWACHANDAATCVRDVVALDQAVQEGLKFYQSHKDETLLVVTADHETGGMSVGFAGTGYATHLERLGRQKMSASAFGRKVYEYRKAHTVQNAKFEDLQPLLAEAMGLSAKDENGSDELAEEEENEDLDDAEPSYYVPMALSEEEVGRLGKAFDAGVRGRPLSTGRPVPDLVYGGQEPLAAEAARILSHKAGIGWTTWSHTGLPVPVSAVGVGQETFNGLYDNTDVQHKMSAVMGLIPSRDN